MNNLVSTNWVYKNLNKENMVILDCSWHMKDECRDAKKEFLNSHIKKSYFFDIDKISKKNHRFPHTMPTKNEFIKGISNFGIKNESKIILYDSKGIFSSPRVWITFKYFGHNNVFIMNGGLKKWIKEKKPLTKKISSNKKSVFKSTISKEWITNYKNILNNINNKNTVILDARNKSRFLGKINEKNVKIRSGHIPNSKNLFWKDLISENGTFKSKSKIIRLFREKKIYKKEIITTCGSGITACILSLSLFNFLNIKSSVYDGSWTEWGQNKNLPIDK